jgi:ATP synthase protein I
MDRERERRENDPKDSGLPARVGRKAERRIKARRSGPHSVWFGMGMFGLVGWTVAISTLLGVVLGVWIDRTWPSRYSWTLMLLLAGLMAGLMNAWYWVRKESREDEDQNG